MNKHVHVVGIIKGCLIQRDQFMLQYYPRLRHALILPFDAVQSEQLTLKL